MLDAIAAERLKFARHRATWGLVWIWPIGVAVIWLIWIAIVVAGGHNVEAGGNPNLPRPDADAWAASRAGFWSMPSNGLGRYVIGSFVAVVFAGEYGWNTWKLIVPHRSRGSLIAAKYVMSIALIFAGFVLAALLLGLLDWLREAIIGLPVPEGLTVGVLASAQLTGLLSAVGPVVLTTAYVSLFAVLTRSTVGALIIGIVLTTVEAIFLAASPVLAMQAPGITKAVLTVMPGYHVGNIGAWLRTGEAIMVPLPPEGFSMDPGVSLGIVAAWVVVLVGLTFRRFATQDIN